ncbi:hypothetical protein J6590_075876 [Homalodisca vitripennis]|nr:hypothetical protein J6590_094508 [Homalodisca vitripennis]KAG8315200.1 hypothetical protein J6590_075876 [Homalodisca vitripennis]
MDTKKYSLFRNQDLLPASRNVILLRECVDCWRRTVSGDMCRYSSNFSRLFSADSRIQRSSYEAFSGLLKLKPPVVYSFELNPLREILVVGTLVDFPFLTEDEAVCRKRVDDCSGDLTNSFFVRTFSQSG